MRIEIGLICGALLITGCRHAKPPVRQPPPATKPAGKTYVTPELGTIGRVEMVNTAGRFVVISFPAGHVPPLGQHWTVRHQGLKIGRVTISGPQHDIDTVADIVEGDANVGDEVARE
ncbi:MAG TPA: hypothetical protein VGO59_13555 [Verrucomicrobiae bacterium]|jgi:hypothetical protein